MTAPRLFPLAFISLAFLSSAAATDDVSASAAAAAAADAANNEEIFTLEEAHRLRRQSMQDALLQSSSSSPDSSSSSAQELRSFYYFHAGVKMAAENTMKMSSGHANKILLDDEDDDDDFLLYLEDLLEGGLAQVRKELNDAEVREKKGTGVVGEVEHSLDGPTMDIMDGNHSHESHESHSPQEPMISSDNQNEAKDDPSTTPKETVPDEDMHDDNESQENSSQEEMMIASNMQSETEDFTLDASKDKDTVPKEISSEGPVIDITDGNQSQEIKSPEEPNSASDNQSEIIEDSSTASMDITPEERLHEAFVQEFGHFQCHSYPSMQRIPPSDAIVKWKELRQHFWKFSVNRLPPGEEEALYDGAGEEYPKLHVNLIIEEDKGSNSTSSVSNNDTSTSTNNNTQQQQEPEPEKKTYGLFASEDFNKGDIVYSQRTNSVFFLQDVNLWRRFLYSLPDSQTKCLALELTLMKQISYPGRWMLGLVLDNGVYMRNGGGGDVAFSPTYYNVELDDERSLDFVAVRNIKKGEEIVGT